MFLIILSTIRHETWETIHVFNIFWINLGKGLVTGKTKTFIQQAPGLGYLNAV